MKATILNRRRSRVRRAFTLIELLLVMVIIAILATIVAPNFTHQSQTAKIRAAQGDISAISTQLRAYEVTQEKFPSTDEGIQALVDAKLLDKVPADPWGHPYIYRTEGNKFDLYSMGPNGQDENQGGDDVAVTGQAGLAEVVTK